jgi:hypothetical protein
MTGQSALALFRSDRLAQPALRNDQLVSIVEFPETEYFVL